MGCRPAAGCDPTSPVTAAAPRRAACLRSYTVNAPYRLGVPHTIIESPLSAGETRVWGAVRIAPMTFSATHLKRYRQIAGLLWKYGRSDLAQQMALPDEFDPQELKTGATETAPERLADDLEAMGPTYVKMGQVLAGRPDLLPKAYLTALARLQDGVKPFAYEEVEQILLAELGVRVSKAFSRFDTEPLAAASLGQVHMAALRDGRQVVVKVQRPDIRRQIADDFEVLAEIASFLDEHTEIGRRCRLAPLSPISAPPSSRSSITSARRTT